MPEPRSGDVVPLVSEFAGDADMAELIGFFRSELGERVSALRAAVSAGDAAGLARLAHQLKGAAAGYGYPSITAAAGRVEGALKSGTAATVAAVATGVRELIELCERARGV